MTNHREQNQLSTGLYGRKRTYGESWVPGHNLVDVADLRGGDTPDHQKDDDAVVGRPRLGLDEPAASGVRRRTREQEYKFG